VENFLINGDIEGIASISEYSPFGSRKSARRMSSSISELMLLNYGKFRCLLPLDPDIVGTPFS
jgi:hypothetical protein